MKNAEKPLLSISLLASDRLDTIPRCLESLTPIREAIPCELIIVDTSKNPEVHECILRYTDLVEMFEWCNDFSKARNVGLKKAKGEWFMYLDDDEWFLDCEPLISFFQSGEYKEYGQAHYLIRNYMDQDYTITSDGWVRRMVQLRPDTQFCSKIHEYLAPNVGRNKVLEAIVGHSGYIYKSNEEKYRHFERNSLLLKKMEEEEPDNLRWKIQQIQEYRSIRAWNELETYCKKSIDYLYSKDRTIVVTELVQIYTGYIYALLNTKKYKEAIEFYEKNEKWIAKTFLMKMYIDYYMALIYYELEDFEEVCKYASDYLAAYELYQDNPKVYNKEKLGSVFSEPYIDVIYQSVNTLMLIAEIELKKYENIQKYYPNILWYTQSKKLLLHTHIKLLEAFISLEDDTMLKEVLQKGLTCRLKKTYMDVILHWKDKDDVAFFKILKLVKNIDIWNWYQLYARLISKIDGMEEARKIGIAFIKETSNVFQIPNTVRESFEKYGIEMESLYKEVDFETWKNHVVEHFECANMSQLDELKDYLGNSSLKDDIRFGYFMMLYSEQKLIQSIDAGLHMDEYSNLLASFSTYTCITYEALYGAGIRELPVEELPNNYHAALWIQKFFEEAGNDLRGALPCLGKVAEVYPFLQESVKYYLHLIKTEVFQR